jgi:hypothetical protein
MALPPSLPPGAWEQALDMKTFVEYERGQWVVYMDVMFWNETRRFRIEAYRSERLAQLAAAIIHRYADRDPPFRARGATTPEE